MRAAVFFLLMYGMGQKAAVAGGAKAPPRAYLEAHFRKLLKTSGRVTKFRLGIVADTHIESQYGINKAAWIRTVARWKQEGCLLGFVTGDLGYGKPEQVEAFATGIKEVPGAPERPLTIRWSSTS